MLTVPENIDLFICLEACCQVTSAMQIGIYIEQNFAGIIPRN
jgi:hypothetical protein